MTREERHFYNGHWHSEPKPYSPTKRDIRDGVAMVRAILRTYKRKIPSRSELEKRGREFVVDLHEGFRRSAEATRALYRERVLTDEQLYRRMTI